MMLSAPASFHKRVAQLLTGMMVYRANRTWVYPPLQGAREREGLLSIKE